MNTATFPGGTLTNSWDADEHRVKFTATGGSASGDYTFVFDPTDGIPAVLQENTPSGTAYYIREPGGELIARQTASEGIRYYHFDELGSTRLITDGSGSVADRCTYDAYGAVLSHDRYSGSIDQPYQYVGRLGYYTHWQIAEFGWLQLGVRFYDPQAGRFERRDPLPTDLINPYEYVQDQPLHQVDPAGLKSRDLANAEWKTINCHLRGLCACLPPARGNDWGYEKLREHICKYKDARDKYHHDPDYPEFAATKPEFLGWWPGMLIGHGSAAWLCGCRYQEGLAVVLVHEFMHFNDGYWYPYIRAGFWIPYTGEDPHIYYNNYARLFVQSAEPCLKDAVSRCCR